MYPARVLRAAPNTGRALGWLLLAAVAMVAPLARYRYPIEPLLGLLAAGGVTTVIGLALSWARRERSILP